MLHHGKHKYAESVSQNFLVIICSRGEMEAKVIVHCYCDDVSYVMTPVPMSWGEGIVDDQPF